MPDQDGYPEEEELERVKNWTASDVKGRIVYKGLVEFLERIWWCPDFGFSTEDGIEDSVRERPITILKLSTGGWSGNEEIIGALRSNFILWSLCWVQSRRGGHYILHLPKEMES